jgi:hypothetical protein
VGPRAGLDDLKKRKFLILQGLELRPLSSAVRSQSLYRLRYTGCKNRTVDNVQKHNICTIVVGSQFCFHVVSLYNIQVGIIRSS